MPSVFFKNASAKKKNLGAYEKNIGMFFRLPVGRVFCVSDE